MVVSDALLTELSSARNPSARSELTVPLYWLSSSEMASKSPSSDWLTSDQLRTSLQDHGAALTGLIFSLSLSLSLFLDCINNDKKTNRLLNRSQLDEICQFVYSKPLDSFTFRHKEADKATCDSEKGCALEGRSSLAPGTRPPAANSRCRRTGSPWLKILASFKEMCTKLLQTISKITKYLQNIKT